jgi:uncharacterized RDD family membrane protein YckC
MDNNIKDKLINNQNVRYASFGMRVASFAIDNLLFYIICFAIQFIFGNSIFSHIVAYFFTFALFFMFNFVKCATPAKLMLSIKLADEDTFKRPADKHIISRYVLSSGFFALYNLYAIFFNGESQIIWLAIYVYIALACLYALLNDKVQSWYDKQTKIVVIHD